MSTYGKKFQFELHCTKDYSKICAKFIFNCISYILAHFLYKKKITSFQRQFKHISPNHYQIVVVIFKFAQKILNFGMEPFYGWKRLTKKFHKIPQLSLHTLFTERTRVHIVSYTSTQTLMFAHHNPFLSSDRLQFSTLPFIFELTF